MKRFLRLFPLLFGCPACSAHGGPSAAATAGSAPVYGAWWPTDGCNACSSCVTRCICMTGDYVTCPEACGATGSAGAPAPKPTPPPTPDSDPTPAPDPSPDPNPPPSDGGSGGT